MSSKTNPLYLLSQASCSESDTDVSCEDFIDDSRPDSDDEDFIDDRTPHEMEFGPELPPRIPRLKRTVAVPHPDAPPRCRPRVDGDSTDSNCPLVDLTSDQVNEDFGALVNASTEELVQAVGLPLVEVPAVGNDPRHRCLRFCFTLNNYTPEEVSVLREKIAPFAKYLIYGEEVGESGTPHLQGYIEVKTTCTVAGLQKKILGMQGFVSRYAVFACKGNAAQNIAYCSKSGVVWELGVRPKGQGKRSDLEQVATMIMDENASLRDVAIAHPTSFMKYGNGFSKLINLVRMSKRVSRTRGLWCFGVTGSGKSRFAHGLSPESTYVKDPSTKWWCGYNQEDTVIVDDYRSNAGLGFSDLLRLADFHPLPIEMKGSAGQFNSKRIVITTPLSIDATFAHLDWMSEGSLDQLKRRFVELEFGPGKLTYALKLSDVDFPDDVVE